MILLYSWLSAIYWTPGPLNSNLIKTEKAVPSNPENKANIRYRVPISFAFEDKNHLSVHNYIDDLKTKRLDLLTSSDCSSDIHPLNDILVLIWGLEADKLLPHDSAFIFF